MYHQSYHCAHLCSIFLSLCVCQRLSKDCQMSSFSCQNIGLFLHNTAFWWVLQLTRVNFACKRKEKRKLSSVCGTRSEKRAVVCEAQVCLCRFETWEQCLICKSTIPRTKNADWNQGLSGQNSYTHKTQNLDAHKFPNTQLLFIYTSVLNSLHNTLTYKWILNNY